MDSEHRGAEVSVSQAGLGTDAKKTPAEFKPLRETDTRQEQRVRLLKDEVLQAMDSSDPDRLYEAVRKLNSCFWGVEDVEFDMSGLVRSRVEQFMSNLARFRSQDELQLKLEMPLCRGRLEIKLIYKSGVYKMRDAHTRKIPSKMFF